MFDVLRGAALLLGAALPLATPSAPSYCGPAVFSATVTPPFGTSPAPLPCRPYVVDAPNAALMLAVARTRAERQRGLMNVTGLAPRTGMLFAFTGDEPREFWMKNTLIPLDMVFVDAHGVVTSIAARVPASTLRTPDLEVARRSGHGKYVIELRAGEAQACGLSAGTRVDLQPVEADP
jgi:uncharacterized membrane protein (UPF0127 family)